ncbi:hypothetical protein VTI74DRAFT_6561 [Chaetomium olivicolor]
MRPPMVGVRSEVGVEREGWVSTLLSAGTLRVGELLDALGPGVRRARSLDEVGARYDAAWLLCWVRVGFKLASQHLRQRPRGCPLEIRWIKTRSLPSKTSLGMLVLSKPGQSSNMGPSILSPSPGGRTTEFAPRSPIFLASVEGSGCVGGCRAVRRCRRPKTPCCIASSTSQIGPLLTRLPMTSELLRVIPIAGESGLRQRLA